MRYIHYYKRKPKTLLKDVEPVDDRKMDNHEPHGLWFSVEDVWLEWCKENYPTGLTELYVELDVTDCNIYLLKTANAVAFEKKYGNVVAPLMQQLKKPDWTRL